MQLDYSSLSREHKAASEGRERDKLAAQFQADIEERSGLLAKLAPNLKAVEQYEAVKVSFLINLAHAQELLFYIQDQSAFVKQSSAVCSQACPWCRFGMG